MAIIYLILSGRIDLSRLISEPNGDASMSRFQLLIFTFVVAFAQQFFDSQNGKSIVYGTPAKSDEGSSASYDNNVITLGPRDSQEPETYTTMANGGNFIHELIHAFGGSNGASHKNIVKAMARLGGKEFKGIESEVKSEVKNKPDKDNATDHAFSGKECWAKVVPVSDSVVSELSMKLPSKIRIDPSEWTAANRSVVWGWKRDSGSKQRIIFFAGNLELTADRAIELKDWCFFMRSRAPSDEIEQVLSVLSDSNLRREPIAVGTRRCERTNLQIVELRGGPGLERYHGTIRRILNRRPRKSVPTGSFPQPSLYPLNATALGPVGMYVGSGLSYEAGLPTLASVHELFGVDRQGADDFSFGSDDPIPKQLARSLTDTFGRFIDLHLQASVVPPSQSHLRIATLFKKNHVAEILTDNIDNLFAKLGVPFTRTRGPGVFNDRFDLFFRHDIVNLIVIGVAADRRSIIQQARKQGVNIIVVNPFDPVSPKSQNLSYLRPKDVWYKMTARRFFEEIWID